jgi:hypothetical protein
VATIDGTVPLAVLCENDACEHCGDVVNEFAVPGLDVDRFWEAFGHGAEDPADYCPSCGVLGALSEIDQPACACGYCTEEAARVAELPVRARKT